MISLDLMKSSEVRIAAESSNLAKKSINKISQNKKATKTKIE